MAPTSFRRQRWAQKIVPTSWSIKMVPAKKGKKKKKDGTCQL